MQVNLTGIQAEAKKNFETFQTLRPVGAVTLVHDKENEYDSFCIQVFYGDICLGYIPALKKGGEYIGSELQKHIIDNNITTALINSYQYLDEKFTRGKGDFEYVDEHLGWNDQHKGHLQSVTLEIDIPENDSGRAIGGKYLRVTTFISYFAPYGGSDGLIKWAFNQADTYDGYRKRLDRLSEDGTAMHASIEAYLNRTRSAGELEALPDGWLNFVNKYEIDVIETEKRFYDNTLGVTGQPDLLCFLRKRGSEDEFKLTVVDWKSKKKPSMKEQLQLSIYSKNKSFEDQPVEQAIVVCFGAENAQGFTTATYKRDKIEATYQAMILLRKVMEGCGVWVHESKYWGIPRKEIK